MLAEALAAARAIDDEGWRALVLSAVAEHLPANATDLLGEALTAARAIRGEDARAEALTAVAARLPADQQLVVLAQALAAARAIDDEDGRTQTLATVAEHLPANAIALRSQVLQDAMNLSTKRHSADLLSFAVPAWTEIAKRQGKRESVLLSETLSAFARAGRSNCLGAIEAFVPVIERLGGVSALQGSAQAISDTAKWWP